MIDALSRLQFESVDPVRQSAWLPVVDVARLIKHDDDVVVKMRGTVDGDVSPPPNPGRRQCAPLRRSDLPRSRPDKLLTRHARKSLNQRRRIKIRHKPDLIRVEASIIFNAQGHGVSLKLRPSLASTTAPPRLKVLIL